MMLSLFFMLLKLHLLTVSAYSSPPIAKPGCHEKCGNISIPYPFGISAGCYYNSSYEIICDSSFDPPKPLLHKFHLEVMDININTFGTQTLTVGSALQNICTEDFSIDLRGSPYAFSIDSNVFVAVDGCGTNVMLKDSIGDIVTGCSTICTNTTSMNKTNCFGISCCQATIDQTEQDGFFSRTYRSLNYFKIEIQQETMSSSQTCNVVAGLLDSSHMTELSGKLLNSTILPTILEWSITLDTDAFSHNSDCFGSRCECNNEIGYEGNPYLPNGCQLASQCQKCKHGCVVNGTSADGSYIYVCKKRQLLNLASILGFSISTGSVMLVLASYWLYRLVKIIKKVRQKAKYFKRNGGLLLQQQISSRDGIVDKTRIFSLSELEKATNNFSEDRILGQGGQGTVYKGMLTDGRIVAIKKSKKVDTSQLEQFINEMVILSQVNHRSVVKLLGCCLETDVPLLVYEFIPNGTLHQHIHDPNEEFHITWRMWLQIAAESASALAYLHSSLSSPIYHRDIKSSNILLDEKYRAKVSDFGTSRAIAIEQTHVTTCVQGTYGYLDPEYFQSNQFTEKSDVYSFGVVLVELITGKKPILPNGSGGWISLASKFLLHMENSSLFDILDSRLLEEANEQDLIAVANIERQCLNMKGKERPTMKEVSVLLDEIRSPHVSSKPKEPECSVSSDSVVMEYNYPFDTSTSSLDNSPRASFSVEALPLMGNN